MLFLFSLLAVNYSYLKGIPDAVVAPDVFVVFGVSDRKRLSYKVWQEGGKTPDFVLEVIPFSLLRF